MTILGNFKHFGTSRLALALSAQGCFNLYAHISDCTLHFLSCSYTVFSIALMFYFALFLFRSGHGYEGF